MSESLADHVEAWRRDPTEPRTIALCALLSVAGAPKALVAEVGRTASMKHASSPEALSAVGKMYVEAGQLGDAQGILVSAGKLDPKNGEVYRLLGEVLLRRGDAQRAEKVFERAIALGKTEPRTRLWHDRSKVYAALQARSGEKAVAAELARALRGSMAPPPPAPPPAPRPMFDSELPTKVRPIPSLPQLSPPTPPPGPVASWGDEVPPPPPSSPTHTQPLRVPVDLRPRTLPFAPPAIAAAPASSPELDAVTQARASPSQLATAAFPSSAVLLAPPREARAYSESVPTMDTPFQAVSGLAAPAPAEPRSGPTSVAPHVRDVLDALALAGIYEPGGGAAPSWDKPPTAKTRFSGALIGITLGLAAVGFGAYVHVRNVRAEQALTAAALDVEVETALLGGKPADLEAAEKKLSTAFDLDPNSRTTALLWVKDRVARGLIAAGEAQGIDTAIGRAIQAGVPESQVAFARVGSFLSQGDTAGGAALLGRWDQQAAKDAWFQLLAGAVLERAGDPRAAERYELASKLDPRLALAEIMLIRAVALEIDPAKGAELARAFEAKAADRAEAAALVALAWSRSAARGEAPPEAGAARKRRAELPVALRAVPDAVEALDALARKGDAEASAAVDRALANATSPGMATWIGDLALEAGDDAAARRAALAAVSLSAVYPAARVLAARVALLAGRLDEALAATAELDPTADSVAIVRAAVAYERGDADLLTRSLDVLDGEARARVAARAVVLAPEVLRGAGPIDADKLRALADPRTTSGDLVALDAALDAGDLALAAALAEPTGATKGRPPHALRLARLLRYQGKLEEAEARSRAALEGATATPRALVERVLVLVASGKPDDAKALLVKNPLVLGPMTGWASAYVDANNKRAAEARARVALLEPPPEAAPLVVRIAAALALAETGDRRRGTPFVKALLAAAPGNPDVLAAAVKLKLPTPKAKAKPGKAR